MANVSMKSTALGVAKLAAPPVPGSVGRAHCPPCRPPCRAVNTKTAASTVHARCMHVGDLHGGHERGCLQQTFI